MSTMQYIFNQIIKGVETRNAQMIRAAGETAYENGLFFDWNVETGTIYLEDDLVRYDINKF